MKNTLQSLEDVQDFAKEFLGSLEVGESATVIGLSGDLGSGKTTFVQHVARELGVDEVVNSPTFVIMRQYSLQPSAVSLQLFERLIHIDAYRLEDGADLEKLGFAELLADPTNLILIEWPELVTDALPAEHRTITFSFVDENVREVIY